MELIFNFFIWIGVALFSLFKVYEFGKNVDYKFLFPDHFKEGWSIINRPKDISDYEWSSWKIFSVNLFPWIVLHIFISEILRTKYVKCLKIWYFLLPIFLILLYFGLFPLIIMIIQPLLYWTVLVRFNTSKATWILSFMALLIVDIIKYLYELDIEFYLSILKINDEEFYIVMISISWIQLRCVSFCLEVIKNNKIQSEGKLLDLLSYCFYLPLLFLGPVILYNDFIKSFQISPQKYKVRLKHLFINLGRYLFWFLFIETSLHFMYFNAFQYNDEIVNMMPDWCLYGGGLWMGLFFYLKYLVTYGITGSLAAMDNIVPETPPLCIARVHLYSQMWKYFDVGLHKFLIRYIYKPVIENLKNNTILIVRSFASLLCFLFVLLWHGIHYYIFIWSSLNYLGIIIENLGLVISRSLYYKEFTKKYLRSEVGIKRFYAILSTPILVISALSNFYFFSGSTIGAIYVNRVLNQSFIKFIIMYICLYNCCRVSQFFMATKARQIKV